MNNCSLIGIDLGTSGVKAVRVNTNGTVLSEAYRPYDVLMPEYGYAEQDMELLWSRTREALDEVTGSDLSGVRCIGLSGQMHGTVAVDHSGRPLRNAIIWMDRRCRIPPDSALSELFRLVTLNRFAAGMTAATLLWLRDNEPETLENTYKILLPKDYIRLKLCGTYGTDLSDASGTLLFDTANHVWSRALCDRVGVDYALLPDCHASLEIAGDYNGVPVIYGGGDLSMQLIGNGITSGGVLSSNIGTASQLAAVADCPVYDSRYRTNTFCFAYNDRWTVMGASLNGGAVLKWLKTSVFPGATYADFDAEAAKIPAGSEGLVFLPYLNGERTPHMDPNATGVLFGLTLRHSRAHIIRAAMEGIVYSLRDAYDLLRGLGISAGRIVASGGGARSRMLLQLQADILGADIYTPTVGEQAGYGAAIAAGRAVGIDIIVKLGDEVIHPDPHRLDTYSDAIGIYRELYRNNRNLFTEVRK